MPSACLEQRSLIALQAHLLRLHHRGARFVAGHCGRAAAILLLVFCAPLAAISLAFGARLQRRLRRGRLGVSYTEYFLTNRAGRPLPFVGALPGLFAIATGACAWVGPLPRDLDELDLRHEHDRRIDASVPGLVSPWWVRRRTNIAYGDQTSTDLEFADTRTAGSSIGLLLRALLASFYGAPSSECPRVASILGLPVDNLSMKEAIDALLTSRPDGLPRQVSFINVDCVNKASSDSEYRDILVDSDLRLGDGIGLRVAGRLLGSEIRENVNGTDLFPLLCAHLARLGQCLYLLGGKPGVALKVAEWAASRYPGLRIAGTRHGYFDEAETPGLIEEINASGPTVLLVAFGAPKQEKWIRRHRAALRVHAVLGVGGLLDFYSGRIPRAPQWLREIGLEWTYRLYQEPGRMWRRYLVGNIIFLSRVLRERFWRSVPRQQSESQVSSL